MSEKQRGISGVEVYVRPLESEHCEGGSEDIEMENVKRVIHERTGMVLGYNPPPLTWKQKRANQRYKRRKRHVGKRNESHRKRTYYGRYKRENKWRAKAFESMGAEGQEFITLDDVVVLQQEKEYRELRAREDREKIRRDAKYETAMDDFASEIRRRLEGLNF